MTRSPSVLRILIVGFLVPVLAPLVFADIPQIVSYQGKVTDAGGTPVPNAAYEMQFSIHDAVTGGSELWSSGAIAVDIVGGIFNILLGESPQPAIELAFDRDYWLEVVVESDIQGPRQHLGSVGYAYMASGLVPGTHVTGEVGLGTAILGHNTATTDTTYGLYGRSDSPEGRGVCGEASYTGGAYTMGVEGISRSEAGIGVCGRATNTASPSYGVWGITASPGGWGVWGSADCTTGDGLGVKGTTDGTSGSGVFGSANSSSGPTVGVWGESYSSEGTGIRGRATATNGYTYGVYGEVTSRLGHGIHGYATATEGYADGIFGMASSTDGKGVHGEASATTGLADGVFGRTASSEGRGVYGETTATEGYSYGVYGVSNSTSGTGVFGYADVTTGFAYGLYGLTSSTDGTAVFGRALATTGYTSGVTGFSYSTAGSGVDGDASATTGYTYGVHGRSASTDGSGVCGSATASTGLTIGVSGFSQSTSGAAVYGWALATTGGYGIYGMTSSTTGYAGFFAGDVYVSESINKSACSFLIDHPLDPENKLLRHNCMESPEHLVVYRGKVRLDEDGEAAIEMPEYFTAVAKEDEATIHLTAEGRPFLTGYAWSADHADFTAYGEPNRDVSWMVMAERDDPVIRRVARPVEEEKSPDNKFCDRGKLLDPIAYGYPESMGRNYEREKSVRRRVERATE